jgi:hypothetical protein
MSCCVTPGWFDQAAAEAAAAEQAKQEVEEGISRSAASRTQPGASAGASGRSSSEAIDGTPWPSRHAPGASVQSQPMPGSLEAHDRDSDQSAASEHVDVSHAAASDSTTSLDAEPPEHSAARAQSQAGEGSRAADGSSSAHSTKEQRAQQRQAEADRSWDSLLLRFAESSLFKGGPLPSLQVSPWKAPVDYSWHTACALSVWTSLSYSDTAVSILVIT